VDLSADEAEGNCKVEDKRVRVSGLPKFIAIVDSEASMLKALVSRMLLAPRYHGIFLVG